VMKNKTFSLLLTLGAFLVPLVAHSTSPIEITESTKFSPPDEPLDEQALQNLARELGRKQAQAIIGAKVGIISAFPYHGKTWIQPIEGARIVAIELMIFDHQESLDFDDFEIVDGMTGESYGSDPDIKFLNKEKKEVEWSPTYSGTEREHVLLVYAFPRSVNHFSLRYWGLNLKNEKMMIQKSQSDILNIGMHIPKQ
ncbi:MULTISPECIES: hypothetical protein, partial [unclassified Lentimonas]|uniref:hypothetical protein n=2 Tax=Lentimonas TaxID=417293 RepID=UPI00132904F1